MAGNQHVALLRSLNVAGKNRLPMKELAALFRDAGCDQVRTYIQSGNVVFTASKTVVRRLPAEVSAAIDSEYGYRVPVLVRSADAFCAIARKHPFAGRGVDPKTLHVVFLARRPTAARAAALDPDRSPPDRFLVRGPELYLHCPNGYGKSKLTTAYFDSKLATTCTVRNWKTVLALRDML